MARCRPPSLFYVAAFWVCARRDAGAWMAGADVIPLPSGGDSGGTARSARGGSAPLDQIIAVQTAAGLPSRSMRAGEGSVRRWGRRCQLAGDESDTQQGEADKSAASHAPTTTTITGSN